jgi:electron transport complex protein RnfB
MHVVISELCTGCELCVAPCPVDCIATVEATGAELIWDERRADRARERYEFRRARLARDAAERAARLASRAPKSDRLTATSEPEAKRAAIQAAFERARAKRAAYAARDRGTQ